MYVDGVIIKASELHTTQVNFQWCMEHGAVVLTVKSNQKTPYLQHGPLFEGKRKTPCITTTDYEKRLRRQTRWELRAQEVSENVRANLLCST